MRHNQIPGAMAVAAGAGGLIGMLDGTDLSATTDSSQLHLVILRLCERHGLKPLRARLVADLAGWGAAQ